MSSWDAHRHCLMSSLLSSPHRYRAEEKRFRHCWLLLQAGSLISLLSLCVLANVKRPWHPGAFTFKCVSNQQHTSKTCPPLPLPPWHRYLLSVVLWPGESYLSSLGLSFLICKMAILIVLPLSYSYYKENLKYV